MQKILNNVANNKHRRDLITGQWVKQLKPLHNQLKKNMIDTLEGKQELPDWLVISQTLLLAKTKETDNPQNYRPIALQNTTYKIYTALIAEIIVQHCTQNKIITEKQAAGKRESWGATDQLLINKMIYDEVTSDRRSLAVAWLDYKKAFDSVPHSWILESLRLGKIPAKIINATSNLMTKWKTRLTLHGETTSIETEELEYLKGILQGDTLSLILFILAVNPLSYLLAKLDGFALTVEEQTRIITHLFFC